MQPRNGSRQFSLRDGDKAEGSSKQESCTEESEALKIWWLLQESFLGTSFYVSFHVTANTIVPAVHWAVTLLLPN